MVSKPASFRIREASDNPGVSLVNNPLTTTNYLSWIRAIKIGLSAKDKLEFILSNDLQPVEGTELYKKWKRCDNMVLSWLLSLISKEMADSFLYVKTARELWVELEQRFGESNGPLIFQLKKDIAEMKHGEMNVCAYFTKLKKLWEDLADLNPVPYCECGKANRRMLEMIEGDRLMQFLMGLSDAYENVRDSILISDPLPSVNKAANLLGITKKIAGSCIQRKDLGFTRPDICFATQQLSQFMS